MNHFFVHKATAKLSDRPNFRSHASVMPHLELNQRFYQKKVRLVAASAISVPLAIEDLSWEVFSVQGQCL